MSSPLFSVVIPTYNRSRILGRAVSSVLAQSCGDFELIIVDNGSTDDTAQWLEATFSDPRIRYHYQTGTGNPAGPRNTGIGLARGEWICLLDSDDEWLPEKLEAVKEALSGRPDVDLCGHNEWMVDDRTGEVVRVVNSGPAAADMYGEMLRDGNRLSPSATVLRKSFLDGHGLRFSESPDLVVVEDYDFWLNCAFHGGRFLFIDRVLGRYFVGDDNLIRRFPRYCDNLRSLFHRHVFEVPHGIPDKERLWRSLRSRVALCFARRALAQRRYGEWLRQLAAIVVLADRRMLTVFARKAARRLRAVFGLRSG
ncbi:glycosyltransferase family 2 protein [Endothiovibrio diazotrophicus]